MEDDEIMNKWRLYFAENDHSASPSAVWDSFKLFARTSLISHINRLKADFAGAFDKAVAELSSTEQEYVTNPYPAKADLLKLQTRVVNQLQFERARQKLFFSWQKLFEHEEKAGKLLPYLVHSEDRPPVVINLHGPGGGQITDPPSVTSMFRDFFAGLYTSTVSTELEPMNLFLESVTFPQLLSNQVVLLESLLTIDEIVTAIASFARSESLGSDGLPLEFYSQFSEILTPKLLALYNHFFETFTLPPSMREATIVLIQNQERIQATLNLLGKRLRTQQTWGAQPYLILTYTTKPIVTDLVPYCAQPGCGTLGIRWVW